MTSYSIDRRRGETLLQGAPVTDGEPVPWQGMGNFGVLAVLSSGLLAVAASLWWLYDANASFMALGWAAAFVVSLPFLARDSSWQSPWTLVAAAVYIGCGIRGTFIAFGVEGPNRSLQVLFLRGEAPEYFIWPSTLHLIGLIALTLGYVSTSPRRKRRTRRVAPQGKQRVLGRHTPLVAVLLGILGFVALLAYIRATGGFSLDSLSAKRTTINGLNLSDDYESHGALRFLSGFATAGFWLAVAYAGVTRRAGRKMALAGPLIFLLGVNAILFPFYSSSRSSAAFILLVAGAIHFAFGGKFSRRSVVLGLTAFVVIVSTMTVLRAAGASSITVSGPDAIMSSFVYNRNFGDMQNTSHIVRNVPSVIPFQKGETMLGYLVAPVPRAIWPEKPIVNAGPMIGVYIYGTERSGVPPGIFGDFYLNFGAGAVFPGGLLTGILLGWIERWRRGLRFDQSLAVIIYCTVGFRLGLFAMNKGLAFAIFKGALELVPVLIALFLAMQVITHKRPQPARRRL